MKVMKVSVQNGLAETLTNVESYTSPQRCIELGFPSRDDYKARGGNPTHPCIPLHIGASLALFVSVCSAFLYDLRVCFVLLAYVFVCF